MKCAALDCTYHVQQSPTGRPAKYCGSRCADRARKQAQRERERLSVTLVDLSRKHPDILFYCGLNEKFWNHHEVSPGTHVCIAPVTLSERVDPITKHLPKEQRKTVRALRKTQVRVDPAKVTHVLLDSGAFSDGIELQEGNVVKSNRLSFDHALQRQIAHAYEFRYAHLVEAIVSYDLLIDETWQNGERSKKRWGRESAEYAVSETVAAARYLSSQRRRIDHAFGHHVRLVLSAQGVEAEQYKRCAQQIVAYMKPDDIFGLGGWCISGLMRHIMLPAAASILPAVFEVLAHANVKRVHVFGVILPRLLGYLLHLCDCYGIQLSTDSAGPAVEPVRNGNWGYGSWTNPEYKKPFSLPSCRSLDASGNRAPACTPDVACAGQQRIRHVRLTREWLSDFRTRESGLIAPLPQPAAHQLALMEVL